MRVAAVMADLLLFSRIDAAAQAAGAELVRVDEPAQLPDEVDLVLVDWASRRPGWADALGARGEARIVLFGPHTDLEAHADARAAGLGPMWARSKLFASLGDFFGAR
ncbi:MAG: hypothetical protein ACRDGD_04475 [Candidatus Limnocylindria bacterium]